MEPRLLIRCTSRRARGLWTIRCEQGECPLGRRYQRGLLGAAEAFGHRSALSSTVSHSTTSMSSITRHSIWVRVIVQM